MTEADIEPLCPHCFSQAHGDVYLTSYKSLCHDCKGVYTDDQSKHFMHVQIDFWDWRLSVVIR